MSDNASAPVQDASAGMSQIEVADAAGAPVARYHMSEDGDYIVGRDRKTAHILIDDKSVSRRHALVRRAGGRLTISDTGSLNGTIVGDGRRSGVSPSVGESGLDWLEWPETVPVTVGVFTLTWRSLSGSGEPEAVGGDHPAIATTTLGSKMAETLSRDDAMVVTLSGRWQTRVVLFFGVLLPVSLLFAWGQGGWQTLAPEPLALVATMLLLGLVLDPVYHQLQRFRWDQDWPFALCGLSLALEFAAALTAARSDWLPGLDACRLARIDRVTRQLVCVEYSIPLDIAICQFFAMLVLSLICVAWFGQTIFIRWRFKGGEFGRSDADRD